MNLLRTIALAVLFALSLGAVAPSPPSPNYYVMRHLQKGAAGDDPGLSAQGIRNANRLALWRFWQDPSVPPPTAIYASNTRRAQETAAPLARLLRIRLESYGQMDIAGLVARVGREPGPVLIVGHTITVPEIVERLGGTRPQAIPETRYGDIWRIWGSPLRTSRIRPFP